MKKLSQLLKYHALSGGYIKRDNRRIGCMGQLNDTRLYDAGRPLRPVNDVGG